MPGAKEKKPIPHGLQPGLARENTQGPAKRNRPGRPKGSVNRRALKEMCLQAAELRMWTRDVSSPRH
jgi:hypothetical protein